MKNLFLFPALLAATQFLPPSFAETEAPAMSAGRDAEIIKRYDTNGDGKLDDAEIAAVKEQMLMADQEKQETRIERMKELREQWIIEFDKNKDGKLDASEKQALETTVRARLEKQPRMLKRYDTDGDGKLSDAEWAAARDKVLGSVKS